tara:strand:+ start:1313 stop:2068 length:756 start_codon:yes stop_codon:yes gene_type:complete
LDFNFDIIGAWLVVLMTLSIFSYLYGDNIFYKSAEHIFVGVSAGYIFAITFWDQIYPNLLGRLFPEYINVGYEFDISYIIPFILGIFMILRLVPNFSWLARISIAYIVGMAAGLKFYVFINSNILTQIKSSAINFNANNLEIVNQVIVLIGVLSGLIYFFFSKEHDGTIGKISKLGVYFLMIKFGASFGFAVMGRISLLIGRFEELISYSSAEFNYATPIILIAMIAVLGFWSFKNNKTSLDENNNIEMKS